MEKLIVYEEHANPLKIKNLIVLGFAGHVVSVAAIQLRRHSLEAAIGRWTN